MSGRFTKRGGAVAALAAADVAVVLGCAGATFAMASASAPAPAIVWGPAQPVSINSAAGMYPQVAAISCPAVGDCAAAGDYYNGALPGDQRHLGCPH